MANNLLSQITSNQLRRVLAIREEIERLETELTSIVDGAPAEEPTPKAPRKSASKKSASKAGRKAAKSSEPDDTKEAKGKRVISPESRAKMAEAMRRRWAVKKGDKKSAPAKGADPKPASAKKPASKKKREVSPESRAKMAEAMRRRWAVKKGKR